MSRVALVQSPLLVAAVLTFIFSGSVVCEATTAATPTFSPAAGTYTSSQTVTISDTTSGATIYYTTNGTTPTTSSTKYTAAITVSSTETVKAIATASGYSQSATGSAAYTITPPAATPTFSPAAGTYTSSQTVTISDTTSGATIYYTTNGTTPTTSSTKYTAAITVSSTEIVEAIATASGYSQSATGSAAYTITPPAATPTFSPAAGTYTSSQTVTISDTTSGATIYYTTNGTTPTTSSAKYTAAITVSSTETVEAIATASGYSQSATGSAAYAFQAATPALSPAGGTYNSGQTVTISDATPGATIYYTTNATTPTTSSPVYSAAITVTTNETIEAIATFSGYAQSSTASAVYTFQAGAPTFSPAAGGYTSPQTVTITDSTPGATIYYTTNGTTPTTSSAIYAGPVTVNTTETLEALAVESGYSNSSVASGAYTIQAPAPILSVAAGTYVGEVWLTISDANPAATIYYTTNGTTPTTSSNVYDSEFWVPDSETVEAIAAVSGYSSSAVASAAYTIDTIEPVFTPPGGTYVGSQSVTLSVPTEGNAKIYYTTNGSSPTTSSSKYNSAIAVSSAETIKAIATSTGDSQSPVSSAAYAFASTPSNPTFSLSAGAYPVAQLLTISDATANATIYYTVTAGTTGTTPTTSSSVYTGTLTVSETETVEAIAAVTGHSSSSAASATYTLPSNIPTTTALTITSGNSPVTTVSSGSLVTLQANVSEGGTQLTSGAVKFCITPAPSCADVHLLGSALLNSSGSASISFIPPAGTHTYSAIFVGNPNYATSTSSVSQLAVTGHYATSTGLGFIGTISLGIIAENNIQVNSLESAPLAPTGSVSMVDTSNNNAVLATGTLRDPGGSFAVTGQPSFAYPEMELLSSQPVAIGDFNGDGKLDMAVFGTYTFSEAIILLGNGDGTFSQAPDSPIPLPPYGLQEIAAGDFNGDGKLDLVVLNNYGSFNVLVGNGDGTFTLGPSQSTACSTPSGLATGDFNRDGNLDLVVLCGDTIPGNDNGIVVMLGNGNGTFTQAIGSPMILNDGMPNSASVADFNGDGIPDLALSDYTDSGNSVTILLGNGDGTFTEASGSPLPAGYSVFSVAAADLNGDGIPDLAVADSYAPQVALFYGNGDGTFTKGQILETGAEPTSVTVADFFNEGIPGLAVANNADGTISYFTRNSYGEFRYTATTTINPNSLPQNFDEGNLNGNGPWYVAAADFNNDGIPDVAYATLGGTQSTVGVVLSQLNQTAQVGLTEVAPVGTGVHNLAAVYSGDRNFTGSMSSTFAIQGFPDVGVMTLSPSESQFGTPVNVQISFPSVNGVVPTGTWTCSGAGVISSPVGLNANGSATVQINGLPIGKDPIVCIYTGNSVAFTNGESSPPVIETVTVPTSSGSVSVTPASATVYAGQIQQFAASVLNTSNQAVTWSVSPSNAGSITANGLYTAPASVATAETVSITATSQANTAQSGSALISLSPPACASAGYEYQRVIVINHNEIPNTDQTNFPFLFSTTDTTLASTANGGHVSNSNGNDIIFSADPAGLKKLDHELEEYNPATGQVVAWVRIPTLSQTENTVIYMFYGNPGVSTSQQNPAGVWDPNYKAVYHLANVGSGVATDSTGNTNNGTLTSVLSAAGEIYGGATFNGASSYLQIPTPAFSSYPTSGSTTSGFSGSFSAWFKTASTGVILGQTDGTAPSGGPTGWQPALYIDNVTGQLRASMFSHGGTTSQIVTSVPYNDNNWHFAVDTYTDGIEELYVDGSPVGSQQVSQDGYNSSYAYYVGTGEANNWPDTNYSWFYFNGIVDEVSVSNVARSSDWIQAEYNNQSSPSSFYTLDPENAEQVSPSTTTLSASQSQQFTVLGGSPGSCNPATVSWSSPAGMPGTLTSGGLYTAPNSIDGQQTVTITGAMLGNSTQTVTANITLLPATTMSVAPGYVTLNPNQAQQFTAMVNNAPTTAVSWSVDPAGSGSFTATGLYTAPASVASSENVIITATSLADPSQSVSVTVFLALPAVAVTPSNATLYAGQTQQLSATINDASNSGITWTITPAGVGTVSNMGLYAAPGTVSAQQMVTVTAASVADPAVTATASIVLVPTACAANGYAYERSIVIHHANVPNTDQINFPFLFETTDPTLATVSNGGHVNSSSGYDIIFSTSPDGQTKLEHELEYYSPSSGQVIAWVRIPNLSHSADTTLYVFYGNPSISTPQANPTGVWDVNYQAVYHLANLSSGTATDSTSNAFNGAASAVTPVEGEVDGAGSFNGGSSEIATSYLQNSVTAYTVEAWINSTSQTGGIVESDEGTGDAGHSLTLGIDGSNDCGGGGCGALAGLSNFTGQAMFGDDSSGIFIGAEGITPVNDGNWHHLVGTWSADAGLAVSPGQFALYVDGAPVANPGEIYVSTDTSSLTGSGGMVIGNGMADYSGSIDELRISTTVRSADWIATEFNNESAPSNFYSLGAENAIAISPQAVTLSVGETQQFQATGICTSSVNWSLSQGAPGMLSASGLYTPPEGITSQQILTVTAASTANQTNLATATVTLIPAVSVSMTPTSATLTPNQTQRFYATVANNSDQAVTWTISPAGVGIIDGNGTYTAPSTITAQQTVTVTATSQVESGQAASSTVTLTPTQCAASGYGFQRVIVIDHTKIPNSDQTNFPFLFNTSDPDFASADNGGHVANPNGYDIMFSLDPGGASTLSYEMEQYNPSTGQVVAWMNIPTLSHTADTVLYVFYGNPNISTPQQNPAAVWNANYQAVYHLANAGGATATDSTVLQNNGTLSEVSAATGEVDGAAAFNGLSSYVQIPSADFSSFPTGQYSDGGFPSSGDTTSFVASFGVWFKTANAGGILSQLPSQVCTVFCIGDYAGTQPGQQYGSVYDYPGGWNAMLYVDDNGHLDLSGGTITSPAKYNDNNWHFAVVTYAENGTDTLYVDGQSVASGQVLPSGYSQAYNYFVGSAYTFQLYQADWTWLYFNGILDEVSVTNNVLSADWVQTEYNNQSSPSTFYKLYSRSTTQVAPNSISLYAGQGQQFAVPGSCDAAVTFSIPSGSPGTISTAGFYSAPESISSSQSVMVTATASGQTVGSATVTLLPPPAPITLATSEQPPYVAGSTESFTATLLNPDGSPTIGAQVSFVVSGANSTSGSSVTNEQGTATYSYTGANSGSDAIQATSNATGVMLTSNSVSVSWTIPSPQSPAASVTLSGPPSVGAGGLMGAFTNSSGAVIEPLAIGASPSEFVVPAGASQLQLGIDSTYYPVTGGPGYIVNVNGNQRTVPPNAISWNWVSGGLNNNYEYGTLNPNIAYLNGTSPIVGAASLTPGQIVSVAYQSGTVSNNFGSSPLKSANGDQSMLAGVSEWQGTYFPTAYTTSTAYPVGQPIPFSAVVTNASGAPASDVTVTLTVSGANPGQYQAITDSTGTAAFVYTGTQAGTDSLVAEAEPAGAELTSALQSVAWVSAPTSTNLANLSFQLYVTLDDVQGYTIALTDSQNNPITDAGIGVYVWGVDNLVQTTSTDVTGHGFFTYSHTNPGAYNVMAVATVNGQVLMNPVPPINGIWTPASPSSPCSDCNNNISVSIAANTSVTVGSSLQLTGTVTDNIGVSPSVTWTQLSGPGTVTFANSQQAITTATFNQIGTYVVQLYASDSGANAAAQFQISVVPSPLATTSQGWIASPLYGSAVTGVVPITLAPGLSLASGTLVYMPANDPNNVTVLGSNVSGAGQVGLLDTTMLKNGSYWIQMQATSSTGSSEYSLVLVTVTGNYKPGRVTTSVTDLVVPASGLSISIQRNYDSLNASNISDFGYGWSLGVNVDLSVDPQGDVTLNLGGQRKTFYLAPQAPACTIVGCLVPYFFAAFSPEPGAVGTLTDSGQGCPLDIVVLDGSTWECQDGSPYTPSGYVYTDPTGTTYTISTAGGLQSIVDRNNNGLTITSSGITSTTGLSVPFVRDSQNRITQITDPEGNVYSYGYDDYGNLATVTYPPAQSNQVCSRADATNTSQYSYYPNSENPNYPAHYYASGTDGRCNPLPSTAYYAPGEVDSEGNPIAGKLENVTDALGETTSYTYNLSTNTTTVTYPRDANGYVGSATMVYDGMGDLLSSTDPLGHTTTNAYDANYNLLTTTDPLGHTTSYTHDQNGNQTSQTYPATATSTNTTSTTAYNQYSEPTQTADEDGNLRTFNYDANYNPQSVTDVIGTLMGTIFNPNGTLQAGAIGYDITQSPSRASQFTYDANGNLAIKTDALGRTTSYTYNALGQKLTMTEPIPSGSNATAVTTTYTYDALGNLTQTAAPLSRVTSSTYDSNGNKLSDTDARGNTTNYAYDALNRLTLTTYPDGHTASKTYDFRNNVVTETDQNGNVTLHRYDLAGRQTSVIMAYGTGNATPTTYTLDAAGRKTAETDALSHVTDYTYDNAGNLLSVSGVKGTFSYTYDNARNQISMTDGNSNKTQYTYDARKRMTVTTFPDTTTKTNAYDGPGNLASVTDQAGNQVQYTYDAANQLSNVVQVNSPNTSANTTVYGYDSLGNPITLIDANTHTTMQSFDPLNELLAKTLPDGTLTESRQYDQNGNLSSVTHFNGVITTYAYDQLNRLLSRATPGEATASFTYTPTGKYLTSSDASGTTTYTYDNMDRLATKATPEGTLTYEYDAAGHVASIASSNSHGASMSYTYDDLNRLSTVVDGRLTGQNTTTYAYDSANNVATVTYPNGVESTFTYDALNRVTGLASQPATYTYHRGLTGNLTGATESTGRTESWSYDGIYRLTNETIASAPSGKDGSVGYGLDPVGNRLTESSTLSGINSGSFGYNPDDEVSSESYDQNGNVTATGGKTFTYDSENHLVSMTASGTSVSIVYDALGNRVAKTVNGVTTKYLVEDDLNPTGYPQVFDELSGSTVTRTYSYGLQRIDVDQPISGVWTPSYYGYDGGGNVRQLTNSAGTVTDSYEYDAFGNSFTVSGTTPNNYLYRGEQYDPDLGLYYLRARYYNPITGRFMSIDPNAGKFLDPKTLHKYLYADGDPINGIDPSGRIDIIGYVVRTAKSVVQAAVEANWTAAKVLCLLTGAALVLHTILNWDEDVNEHPGWASTFYIFAGLTCIDAGRTP